MRIGLTWKIFAAMLVVALAPMLVLGYIVRMSILSNLETAAHRQLETQLRLAEASVEAFVTEKLHAAKTVAALPSIVGMNGSVQRPVLQAMAQVDPDFASIWTVPPNGVSLVVLTTTRRRTIRTATGSSSPWQASTIRIRQSLPGRRANRR